MAHMDRIALVSVVCLTFVVTLSESCTKKVIPASGTRRYFKMQINGERCFNPSPIEGVAECWGGCESTAMYNPGSPTIDRHCYCCIPVGKPATIDVTLECPNGETFSRKMFIPTECACDPCQTLTNINPDIPIPK